MQGAYDAQRSRINTGLLPGRMTGIKSRYFTAPSAVPYRSTPYDGVDQNVALAVGGGPRGRQSNLPRRVSTLLTPSAPAPFGGNPGSYTDMQFGRLATSGLSLGVFGGARVAQPDLTAEVAGENGYSTFAGATAAPPRMFPQFGGAPGAEPTAWGMNAPRVPTALNVNLPDAQPLANGDNSNAFFQSTREGTASSVAANPFESFQRASQQEPLHDGIESMVNQHMLHASAALVGQTIGWDQTLEGQIIYQLIQDTGELAQAVYDYGEDMSLEQLPHSFFDTVSMNYWLATHEPASRPYCGWSLSQVMSLFSLHGLIHGDSSARMAKGERMGLSRRMINANCGGGADFIFDEWPHAQIGQACYHKLVRVNHANIRASPSAAPGTYSIVGSSDEVLTVPADRTKNPWQLVPWHADKINGHPTRKDIEFLDDDKQVQTGALFLIGHKVQSVFAAPFQVTSKYASASNYMRAQLPIIGLQFVGEQVAVR